MMKQKFKTDENLIYHLIDSQKVNINSAIAELIQNSFDAEASICNINYNEKNGILTIEDNGRGFKNEKEIDSYFATFGTAHKEDNTTKFGRFRIGRSQIFSMGKSEWKSGKFNLSVDIKNEGLYYTKNIDLQENIKGCNIYVSLYKEYLLDQEINEKNIYFNLSNKFKYLQGMNVIFNDKLINDKSKLNSIYFENEDFIFIEDNEYIEKGIVNVYNLGVFTKQIYSFPKLNGHIITKKHLVLDVSRTEILETEGFWDRCLNQLKIISEKRKIGKYSDNNIYQIFKLVFSQKFDFNDFFELPLFKEIGSNKQYSLKTIYNNQKEFSFVDYTNNRNNNEKVILDKLRQSKSLLLLDSFLLIKAWCSNKGVDKYFYDWVIDDFRAYIENNCNKNNTNLDAIKWLLINLVNSDNYIHSNEDNYIIDQNDLTFEQQILLQALNKANHLIISDRITNKRKIQFGISATADAWTDGKSYIAINISKIKYFNKGKSALYNIAFLLIHEYTHENAITDLHDFEFYQKFHNILLEDNYDLKIGVGKVYKGVQKFVEGFWKIYYDLLVNNNLNYPNFLNPYNEKNKFENQLKEIRTKESNIQKQFKKIEEIAFDYRKSVLNNFSYKDDDIEFYKNFYNAIMPLIRVNDF